MFQTFASRTASVAFAALLTLAVFSGTAAVAGQQARHVAAVQLDKEPAVQIAAAQRVTVIGHRLPA